MDICSRRNFVKGAGVAAIAASVAAAAGSAIKAGAVELRDDEVADISWDYETDVLVCGFGATGTAAACKAYDDGAEVLLIEKADEANAGGESSCFDGLLTNDMYAKHRYFQSSEDYYDAEGWKEFFRTYNTGSGTVLQWAADQGLDMVGVAVNGGGTAWYAACKADVAKRDITVIHETAAKKLIQSSDGTVLGVIAYQGENPVYIKARRGVCLACGDYSADAEMVKQLHLPRVELAFAGAPANTGDGFKMGLAAGAAMWNVGKGLEFITPSYRRASQELGSAVIAEPESVQMGFEGLTNPIKKSYIWVNKDGERFDSEVRSWMHSKEDLPGVEMTRADLLETMPALVTDDEFGETEDWVNPPVNNWGYPNLPWWEVCDQARIESGPLSCLAFDTYSMGWLGSRNLYTWSMDNSAEVEAGWIVKADTIEELCEKAVGTNPWGTEVRMDPEGLKASIARWNEMCEAGKDEDFGRDAYTMEPIGEGPYYAIEMIPTEVYCTGGLRVNPKMQVVDWDGNPIPRLYAAGCVCRETANSQEHLIPQSGICAGTLAAAEEPWA